MSEIRYYLVPSSVIADLVRGPYVHYGAASVPPDGTLHLVWFNWRREDVGAREAFEAQPGVLVLGDPWEPLPAAALAPLQTLREVEDQRRVKAGVVPAAAVSTTDTVAAALRKAAPRHGP